MSAVVNVVIGIILVTASPLVSGQASDVHVGVRLWGLVPQPAGAVLRGQPLHVTVSLGNIKAGERMAEYGRSRTEVVRERARLVRAGRPDEAKAIEVPASQPDPDLLLADADFVTIPEQGSWLQFMQLEIEFLGADDGPRAVLSAQHARSQLATLFKESRIGVSRASASLSLPPQFTRSLPAGQYRVRASYDTRGLDEEGVWRGHALAEPLIVHVRDPSERRNRLQVSLVAARHHLSAGELELADLAAREPHGVVDTVARGSQSPFWAPSLLLLAELKEAREENEEAVALYRRYISRPHVSPETVRAIQSRILHLDDSYHAEGSHAVESK